MRRPQGRPWKREEDTVSEQCSQRLLWPGARPLLGGDAALRVLSRTGQHHAWSARGDRQVEFNVLFIEAPDASMTTRTERMNFLQTAR
jgi:hypothetical protein